MFHVEFFQLGSGFVYSVGPFDSVEVEHLTVKSDGRVLAAYDEAFGWDTDVRSGIIRGMGSFSGFRIVKHHR